jgi:DNA mismatch repair protein MutS2
MTLKDNKIKKISKNQTKKINKKTGSNLESWNISKRKLSFKPELDIRGKRAEEALSIVSTFIDEAIMVNAKEVKILHGKGNGILRELIRDYLSSVPPISNYQDEHVEFGGAGITVVNFNY